MLVLHICKPAFLLACVQQLLNVEQKLLLCALCDRLLPRDEMGPELVELVFGLEYSPG